MLFGVVFSYILTLLDRVFPRKLPENSLFVRSYVLVRFLLFRSRRRRCSRLSSSVIFSLSSSEEIQLRLTGHTPPSHVSFGRFFIRVFFVPLAVVSSHPFRACVFPFLCFSGWVFRPRVFLDFLDLGASEALFRTLVGRAFGPFSFFLVFVFPAFGVSGVCTQLEGQTCRRTGIPPNSRARPSPE